jgi:FKBP-type peptidyl-prolyl cis-trans isomerase
MKNVIIAIVAIVLGALVLWGGVQYGKRYQNAPPAAAPSNTASSSDTATSTQTSTSTVLSTKTMADGLKIEDLKVGTGTEAKAGDSVSVHYVGTLTNGTKFDSSRDRGTPFTFALGAGQVIKGWDEGVAGMKVGGLRRLTIPPALGYGAQGQGPIPPNATLIFEIELLGVNGK